MPFKRPHKLTYLVLIIVLAILIVGFYSLPTSKIPPKTDVKGRNQWIDSNANNPNIPVEELTDTELFVVVSIAEKISNPNSNLRRVYYELSQRLKNNRVQLPAPHKGCHLLSKDFYCLPPDEREKILYRQYIAKASLTGDFFAQREFINHIYESPACCDYSWLVYASPLNLLRKGNDIVDSDFAKFITALEAVKDDYIDAENVETLKAIALSKNSGRAQAAYELFKIYTNGKAQTRSYSKAYAWLLISHKLGYKVASAALDELEKNIDKDFVIEGQKIADELLIEQKN